MHNSKIYIGSWHSCYDMLRVRVNESHVKETKPFCPPYIKPVIENNRDPGNADESSLANKLTSSHFVTKNDVCVSTCLNLSVYNDINVLESSVVTKPAWVFFKSSTTECYKTIKDEVWYFTPDCSRKTIVDYAVERMK